MLGQGAFEWLNGKPGAGARGCFTQAASREVADILPLSSSLSVYRGQEGIMDQLSKKMQNETGLRDQHSHAWQVCQREMPTPTHPCPAI